MKFNLVIDIPNEDLVSHLDFTKGCKEDPQTMEELVGEINNICYMGLDCINVMISRRLSGLEPNDSYLEKTK